MPNARPEAIAMKMMQISFALPCAERNRTREKAPAIATPAPMFPLTSMITIATVRGRNATAIVKLLEEVERK